MADAFGSWGSIMLAIQVWDFVTQAAASVTPFTTGVTDIAFSRNGDLFAVATRDKLFRVYEATTGVLKATLKAPPSVQFGDGGCLDFGVDDRVLFAGIGTNLLRFDIESQRLSGEPRSAHTRAFGLFLSPSGDLIATVATDNRLHLWNSADLTPFATNLPAYGDWGSVAFDAEGNRVFVTEPASHIGVFDVVSGDQLSLLETRIGGRISHLQFCADSDTLAVFGGDRVLQLWQAPSFAEIEAAEEGQATFAVTAD